MLIKVDKQNGNTKTYMKESRTKSRLDRRRLIEYTRTQFIVFIKRILYEKFSTNQ